LSASHPRAGGDPVVTLRRTTPADLAFVTALERHPDNRDLIGQWSDDEHLAAMSGKDAREHWTIERNGERAGYLIAYDRRTAGAGVYVKRILVKDKDRGTGRAALASFLEQAFARGTDHVWLIVRDTNARAQAVYSSLGFARFDPPDRERYDSAAEAPPRSCFRMRALAAPAKAGAQ
jgi:ribosomal protein S18 acetylase RimI-like enzyme